ncbi:MAG: hypothetical protein PHV68_03590 [Candidatus Gastranaerophilales bacterium]|nr:hypothetical protein [Candidatus Gastranaerophilales bacterium]
MTIGITTKIFSSLASDSSLAGLATKDMVENVGRTVMEKKESSKVSEELGNYAAKEKCIEEFGTSALWLGGIPLLKKAFNSTVFKKAGLNANADYDLFEKQGIQSIENNVKKFADSGKEIVKEAAKIAEKQDLYKKLSKIRAVSTTGIALVALFAFPVANHMYTKKNIVDTEERKEYNSNIIHKPTFTAFTNIVSKPSFTGGSFLTWLANPLNNTQVLDLGISAGRVSSSRPITGAAFPEKHAEAIEVGAKELGVVYFLYQGGKHIAKGLEKAFAKFGKPIALPFEVLADEKLSKKLQDAIKPGKIQDEVLNFTKKGEAEIINFIDDELKAGNGEFKNFTLKAAQKSGLIDVVEGIRNPLKKINTDKIVELNKELGKFIEAGAEAGTKEITSDNFVKNILNNKKAAVAINIASCCIALSYIIPKAQYSLRKALTGSHGSPGVAEYKNQFSKTA